MHPFFAEISANLEGWRTLPCGVVNMTNDQKELASDTVAAVVRELMTSRKPPSDEEIKRAALTTVEALAGAFAKINEAN
jgi:hypothetical protein